jgi:YD repeat-containing protein
MRPGSGTTTWVYDDNDEEGGKVVLETDALGKTWTHSYDAQSRLATREDPLNRAWTYGYDRAGNITSVVFPNSRSVSMTYDALGRLETRTYPDDSVEYYSRDGNGNIGSVIRTHPTRGTDSVTFEYNLRDLVD